MHWTKPLTQSMSPTPKYSIELLAPARDASVAIAAINHGADAVYIGASSHGARAAAANTVADIGAVCDYAHRFSARVYVTINTLVYASELRQVESLIGELYRAGVDALIVQDLGLLRLDLPPIALHASTQCDIRTPERARFLQDLGFSQLVLPRELTLDEIRAMRRAVSVPLEGFIHGALCVSYSGDCRASLMCGGRSANRGECAQICRLPYDLIDGRGNTIVEGKHLLSLRDLNRLDSLGAMIDAGISSLKIEGRLKDEAYVKNVVSAYDRELRRLGVARTSEGTVERTFTPDVSRSFNRGFTRHFLFTAKPDAGTETNPDTPKSVGPVVARVAAVKGRRIELKDIQSPLNNGDGLNFADRGFRVNKVDGNAIITAEPVDGLRPGTALRRNFDKAFADALAPVTTAVRTIPLRLTLRRAADMLVLESADGTAATVALPDVQQARSPQQEARRRVISKLGATCYRLEELTDLLGDEFVAASTLTELRRVFIDTLDAARAARFERPLRLPEKPEAVCPDGTELTFHANVANPLAEEVYRSHGVSGAIEPALEVKRPEGEVEVMCTRHCIRRELGHCLLTPAGREWPEPLMLQSQGMPPLRLHFDCASCQMHLTILPLNGILKIQRDSFS